MKGAKKRVDHIRLTEGYEAVRCWIGINCFDWQGDYLYHQNCISETMGKIGGVVKLNIQESTHHCWQK
jgi:hypothetical protein